MTVRHPSDDTPVELAFDPAAWRYIEDAIWVYDLGRDCMVWANPAALAFWRADSLEELLARDYASNSDVTKGRLNSYNERFADGETIETDWTLYPGNEPHTVHCRCAGVPLNDGCIAMMIQIIGAETSTNKRHGATDQAETLRDARGRLAQAEARFRTFAEAGSDRLWETDDAHRFVYLSASTEEQFQRPQHDMIGLSLEEIFKNFGADPQDQIMKDKLSRHAEDLAARRPFRDFEYSVKTETGETRYCVISGEPIFDNKGEFRGYRGVGRNITGTIEADRNARALERERDLAVTTNTVMNRFLATMSHELRTPLNAIIGFSEILSDESFGPLGNETYRGYSRDILGSSRHLLSIVEDLLGTSRLDLGEQALEFERVSAQVLSDEILAIAQGMSLQQRILFESDVPDPHLELFIDRRSLKQVALNLLSNAMKFSEPSSTVTLRIARSGEGAEIVVKDMGCGIAEDALQTIFDPLRTADPHRSGSGAGLGLWISKQIVTAHEGTISLKSVVGQGTTATVQLPDSGRCKEVPHSKAV